LSQRGLNPTKPVYDPDRPDGRLNLTASAFNQLGQYKGKKVKEADLYSAFIEVPYIQGAQIRITQCYLQTTPYLPRKHSPDGASQTEVADI